jgi:hypothetical protein
VTCEGYEKKRPPRPCSIGEASEVGVGDTALLLVGRLNVELNDEVAAASAAAVSSPLHSAATAVSLAAEPLCEPGGAPQPGNRNVRHLVMDVNFT